MIRFQESTNLFVMVWISYPSVHSGVFRVASVLNITKRMDYFFTPV